MTARSWDILCEDGPLLAVSKPAGLPTQGVPANVPSLEQQVKQYLKETYQKPGNVYLGIPHRLDRPVSGIVVFAKNSKAAARLAEQFRLRQVRKWYLAVVSNPGLSSIRDSSDCHSTDGESRFVKAQTGILPSEGTLTDWLVKVPDLALAEVVPEGTPGAKRASLRYRVQQQVAGRSLVLIELETGRMHQIRIQFASRGWPIIGDARYGSTETFPRQTKPGVGDAGTESIALHAAQLDLLHPIRYDALTLNAPVPASWSEFGFDATNLNPGFGFVNPGSV